MIELGNFEFLKEEKTFKTFIIAFIIASPAREVRLGFVFQILVSRMDEVDGEAVSSSLQTLAKNNKGSFIWD